MIKTKKIQSLIYILTSITFILFIVNLPIEIKTLSTIILSIGVIYLSINFFYLGAIINTILLLYLPFLLKNYSYIFLNENKTKLLSFILIVLFIMTIVNFLVLSYNLKKTKYKSSLFLIKIAIIFILYIFLIYSIINTFAFLYTYLGNVFNEGIVSEEQQVSHLDALYFSTTTFFTIGLGDVHPCEYSEITKRLVIIQAIISHVITVILWPVAIIFVFDKKRLS